MNILQYFRDHHQEKSYEKNGRIYQPHWLAGPDLRMEARLFFGVEIAPDAVTETDYDLSYSRQINWSWWDRTPDQPQYSDEWPIQYYVGLPICIPYE